MCLVPAQEIQDLLDLARCASQQVYVHEGDNPLSAAINGAVAAVENQLSLNDSLVLV